MKQLTLAAVGFERYVKTTRQAAFLTEMERIVPWSALCGLIEPFYPKPGNGRPPVGVERMLRLYFAAMVQPVGSGGGGGAVRFVGDAAVCRHRSRTRTSAGRDHDVPLPPSARGLTKTSIACW
jgi:hypothetical protein